MATIYEATKAMLSSAFPKGIAGGIHQAFFPWSEKEKSFLLKTPSLIYYFGQNCERITSSGPSGVFDLSLSVIFWGELEEIATLETRLRDVLLSGAADGDGWELTLVQQKYQDAFDDTLRLHRIYSEYKGIAIMEA